MLTLLLSLAVFGAIGVALMRSSPAAGQPSGPMGNGQGEGHTPVVVCHWVPAHGGSFVIITVDDDGADGNNALRAHLHHPNDIINPESLDACVSPTATPPEVTPTTTAPETTPTSEVEPTVIGPTATPEPTMVDPTATPEPTVADPTATPGPTVEGPPKTGGGFPLPGGGDRLLLFVIPLASLGMGLIGLGYWRRRLGQQS